MRFVKLLLVLFVAISPILTGCEQAANLGIGNSDTMNHEVVIAASDTPADVIADIRCDGTSDEIEINQAISNLPVTGGTIRLLEGNYSVTSAINAKSHLTIQGTGQSTRIKLADKTERTYIIATNPDAGEENIHISDLYLDGNRTSQVEGAYCLALINLWDCTISNVWARNGFEGGIVLVAAEGVTVSDCFADGGIEDAFQVAYQCDDITLENCVATGGKGGFEIDDGSDNINLINCTSQDSTEHGFDIHCHAGAEGPRNVHLVNSQAINPAGSGIRAYGETGPADQIRDIHIENVLVTGAHLGMDFLICEGVRIIETEVTSASTSGIYIHGASTDVYIEQVTITDCGENGLYFGVDVGPVSISNCRVDGCANAGIYNTGGLIDIKQTEVTNSGYGVYITEFTKQAKLSSTKVNGSRLDGIYTECPQSIIDQNTISKSTHNGVKVAADGVTVSNNTIAYNGYSGVDLNGASYCTVAGNIVKNNGRSGIFSGKGDNTVTDNQCYDDQVSHTQSYGISIDGSNNTVQNNDCYGNVVGQIQVDGVIIE